MKPITLKDLKPYQTQAAGALAAMIQEYPSARLKARFDLKTAANGFPCSVACAPSPARAKRPFWP